MKDIPYARGLIVIPDYVVKGLPTRTVNALKECGHGLSFPHRSFCQVRIRMGKKTYSKTFAYSRFETGIAGAVSTAMKYHDNLLASLNANNEKRRDPYGKGSVYFVERLEKRRNQMSYEHRVYYVNPVTGKRRAKIFWHAYDKKPTAGQQLHGHRTAMYFLSEQVRIAKQFGTCVDHAKFSDWRKVRYYMEGNPAVDYDSI